MRRYKKLWQPIAQWDHAGLKCELQAGRAWVCGYVYAPIGYGFELDDDQQHDELFEVHGGTTSWHLTQDRQWKIGWDTLHAGDVWTIPALEVCGIEVKRSDLDWHRIATSGNAKFEDSDLTYWTLEKCVTETEKLAEQVAKLMIAESRLGTFNY